MKPPTFADSAPRGQSSADAIVEAADAQDVTRLSVTAEEVSQTYAVGEVPALATVPSGLTAPQAIRQADHAREKFEAARRKLEKLQSECEALQRETEERGAKLRPREDELDQRERALIGRDEAIARRERDAEAGFLARRREIVQPLEDERARLCDELTRLRAQAMNDSQRAQAELQARLDAIEASAREAASQRQRDADQARTRLTDELQRSREDRLQAARAEADRIVAAATAGVEERGAMLDEREAELNQREAALRTQRRGIEADRILLDGDRDDFARRVELAAARALLDAREEVAARTAERDSAREARDGYQKQVAVWRELERQLGGRPASEFVAELNAMRGQVAELTRQLREMPSAAERERVREQVGQLEAEREANQSLRADLAGLKTRLAAREIEAVALETLRAQTEAHKTRGELLAGEVDRLRAEYGELTKKDEAKHPLVTLVELDAKHAQKRSPTRPLAGDLTLAHLAEDLQHKLVGAVPKRELHYSLRDVRSFLGGMAMSRLMLLQGISGTGKTSLPVAVANALGGDHAVIEVQAGWRDRQDLLGFYNAFHRHFYASEFLQCLYRAGTPEFAERVSIVVLDEINLSRVEQFFADFLSLFEKPEGDQHIALMDRAVPSPPVLLKDGRRLPLPKNVWFVGTANHDETTTAFADKTYDRAHVMELPRHTRIERRAQPPRFDAPVPIHDLTRLFGRAAETKKEASQRAHAWFKSCEEVFDREFRLSWGNRLERDIERYVPVICEAGGTVGEAVDHLLATKVLRRVRDRYDVRTEGLERVKKHLESRWVETGATLSEDARPSRSLALIERELRAKQGGGGA
jgi:hypothetical protein